MRFRVLFIPLGLLLLIHAQAIDAYAQTGKSDIPTGTTDAGVKKSTGPAAKERVELVGSTMIGNAEVKFIDASGKVTKTLKSRRKSVNKQGDKWLVESERIQDVHTDAGLVLLNTSKYLSLHDPEKGPRERDSAYPGEYWDEEVEVLNAKGDVLARKQFRTWPGEDLMTTSYWKNEFSRDGSHYYVYYRDEQGGGNIEVYNVSGKTLVHERFASEISDLRIADDGSVVTGEISEINAERSDISHYILLVDIVKKHTRRVLARGDGWTFSAFPDKNRKVGLSLNEYALKTTALFAVEAVPEDLSTLLDKGGKK